MSVFGCGGRWTCPALAVLVSAVIGVVTAFLQITAVITVAPLFLLTVFGVAVVYLAVTLVSAALTRSEACPLCLRPAVGAQLAGILGSILVSLILLAIGFPATSFIGAVLIGVLLFFFSLALTATACVVKCLFKTE